MKSPTISGKPTARLKKRRQPVGQDRRIRACREWAKSLGPGPHGRKVLHQYARANKIDALCALKDLQRLGVRIDPQYAEEIRATRRGGKQKKTVTSDLPEGYGQDWDDHYAYIAGFTSGGAPFGTTWEELDAEALREPSTEPQSDNQVDSRDPAPSVDCEDDDDIPF